MMLGVLKAMKLRAVNPPAIRFARLQFYFHHAGLVIGVVMRFADEIRPGIFPGGGPAPGLVGHFLAERDFDLVFAGRDIFVPASGTVLTTTGAKLSMSCARNVVVVQPHSALTVTRVMTSDFVFM